MKRISIVSEMLLVTALVACSSEPTGPGDPATLEPAVVAFDSRLDDWSQDPYALEEVFVTGDTITFRVSYAGGCQDHEFGLVAYAGWFESTPARAGVLLTHDDNGEDCERLVRQTLRFDLRPIEADYRASYDAGEQVILDLWRGVHEIHPITYQL